MAHVTHQWQLQEAKNKLSHVVDLARFEGPQIITRHGKEAVVVLSIEDFKKLSQSATTLVEFLKKSPLKNAKLKFTRSKELAREIEL